MALAGPSVVFALPDPPPPPVKPDAYVAFVPNSERAAGEPGATWYWQSVVTVHADGLTLEKAAVRCSGSYMSWSSQLGGWIKYNGTISQGPAGEVANLKLELCYDCERSGVPVPKTLVLPVEVQSANTIVVAGQAYTRGVAAKSVCPVE